MVVPDGLLGSSQLRGSFPPNWEPRLYSRAFNHAPVPSCLSEAPPRFPSVRMTRGIFTGRQTPTGITDSRKRLRHIGGTRTGADCLEMGSGKRWADIEVKGKCWNVRVK